MSKATREKIAAGDIDTQLSPTSRRLVSYARLLDSSIRLPGGFRIGLEGLIGLIPGVGDIIGALLSSVVIVQSYREGVGYAVLLRMLLNLALELIVGVIPVVGDIFDFVFKANIRNVELLQQHGENARVTKQRSTLLVVALTGAVLLAVIGFAFIAWQLLAFLLQAGGLVV